MHRFARSAVVLVTAIVFACASAAVGGGEPLPLNLDFSRPGLVDPKSPWGWRLEWLGYAGVQATPRPGELRLARKEAGAPAIARYDCHAAFAGRRIELTVPVASANDGAATIRAGITVARKGADSAQAWSEPTRGPAAVVALDVPDDSWHVQLRLEFSGTGEAVIAPLQLTVDGVKAGEHVPGQRPPAAAAVDWVREHAIALRTAEAGGPLDDLRALREVVGKAPVVMLGESTHGTREFFTLKHRLVRWLAEQEGFTVLAIEDHYGAAAAIDRYVKTGEGDPAALVSKLFGVWSRQSLLDMVRWMRAATAEGRIELSFVGFDLQAPLGAIARLTAFAKQHDPALLRELEGRLAPMHDAWRQGWYPQRSQEEYGRWVAAAKGVRALVESNRDRYRAAAGAVVTDGARYDARLIVQSAEVSRARDMRVRDRFMAENLSWLHSRQPPGTRTVVWAHNTHVRFDENAMGQHFERLHPGVAVSIGFATQRGEYTAWDAADRKMKHYALLPGPPESIEFLLSSSGLPVFALDLRPARTAPAADWFRTPRLHRNIGLFAADAGFYAAAMTKGFTALCFVESTTATLPMTRSR